MRLQPINLYCKCKTENPAPRNDGTLDWEEGKRREMPSCGQRAVAGWGGVVRGWVGMGVESGGDGGDLLDTFGCLPSGPRK